MNKKAKTLVKKLVESETTKHEIRNQLISQGFSTQDFEESYLELLKELGVEETKPKQPKPAWNTIAPIDNPAAPTDNSLPGYMAMIKYGLGVTRHEYSAIVSATLFMLLATGLFMLAPEEPTRYLYGVPYMVVTIGLWLIGFILNGVSAVALMYTIVRSEKEASYMHGLQWTFGHFGSVLWLSLIGIAVSIAGFVALVIPGLAFGIYNLFSLFALIDEDQRGMRAVTRSVDLVMGHFWAIAGRVLVILLLSIPFSIVIMIISVAGSRLFSTLPAGEFFVAILVLLLLMMSLAFSVGMVTSMYKVRSRQQSLYDISQYQGLRLTFWLMFILGIFIPIGAAIAGSAAFNSYLEEYRLRFIHDVSEFSLPLDKNKESFDDFIIQSRVDIMYQAGTVYFGRIRTYEGVCSDVVIEDPAVCKSSVEKFVVYAPLGTGEYYCRDNSGYKDVQPNPPSSVFSCD